MEDQEAIRDFLIESDENLSKLDRELVALEQRPGDKELIASVFRTIHTIKGTCGFFGFNILGSITHIAENVLTQVRDQQREFSPEIASVILETVDAVKTILENIEKNNLEGEDLYEELRQRLNRVYEQPQGKTVAETVPAPAASENLEPAAPQPQNRPVNTVSTSSASANLADRSPAIPSGDAKIGSPALPDNARKEPETGAGSKNGSISDSSIRVDVGLLDKLMNLVGELVLARNQILQVTTTKDAAFNATSQRLNLITSELQEGVMKTRMQPIGVVWDKLPRVVRDLAANCGKRVQIELEGAETELDKTIIEAVKDPLTHIVRNSCDHGIEMPEIRTRLGKNPVGKLTLRAYHEGGHVMIEIADDGAGIDVEKIKSKAVQSGLLQPDAAARMAERDALNLVFQPGFSTAEKVTNVSGRGVGMDVVRTNIEKIGGGVDLFSKVGEGTTVRIKIPLTLAIIPGLVVTLQNRDAKGQALPQERFVIPQANLVELVRLDGEQARKQIESIHGTPVYRRRGKLLPVVYLSRVLDMPELSEQSEATNIVVVQAEDRNFGLVVDGISDTQEIVVKPLGKQLKGLSCYAGATIMGDGKVALILDVRGLAELAGIIAEEAHDSSRVDSQSANQSLGDHQTLLLFRTGRYERLSVPLSLVDRLEEFAKSAVEFAAGRPVLHYRDQILPLVSLGSLLDANSEDKAMQQDPLQVIVFSEGEQRIGMVVEAIVDIVEGAINVRRASSASGLLGSAVVGGKVTDFVDLQAVVCACGDHGVGGRNGSQGHGCRLLLVESSPLVRGTLRSYLEMTGCTVTEASGVQEAMDKLARHPTDVVITATDLASGGGWELLELIRKEASLAHLLVLGMTNDTEELSGVPPGVARFDGRHAKTDRQGLLLSIGKLTRGANAGTAVVGAR